MAERSAQQVDASPPKAGIEACPCRNNPPPCEADRTRISAQRATGGSKRAADSLQDGQSENPINSKPSAHRYRIPHAGTESIHAARSSAPRGGPRSGMGRLPPSTIRTCVKRRSIQGNRQQTRSPLPPSQYRNDRTRGRMTSAGRKRRIRIQPRNIIARHHYFHFTPPLIRFDQVPHRGTAHRSNVSIAAECNRSRDPGKHPAEFSSQLGTPEPREKLRLSVASVRARSARAAPR